MNRLIKLLSIVAKFSSEACRIGAVIFLIFISSFVASQKTNGPKTPMMGWSSWNHFGVNISDSVIMQQADALISSSLVAAGYLYINIDDGFFNGRNNDGSIRIDNVKFPQGMKYLADYIHSKGLKAGIYSDAGANTCGYRWNKQAGGRGTGLYLHDQQDIDTLFKNWGFDYLKVDFCGGADLALDEMTRYTEIKKAIDKTGRTDILLNVCRWQFPGTWVTTVGNSWRISEDIKPKWDNIISIIDKNTFLAPYARAGHYNDMDMLEVGRGLSFEEDKSHFSIWCILSSPLVLGNDLTSMSKQTLGILTNTEVIEINQDTTGLQGRLISDNGAGLQVWAKSIHGKRSTKRAVVLFNRSEDTAAITVHWCDLNIKGTAAVRNLWTHSALGNFDSSFSSTVPPHGVVVLRINGEQNILQEVFEAEYAWINNLNLLRNGVNVPDQGRIELDAGCSGCAKVCDLGKNVENYIEFRDVFADSAGYYLFTLSYLCGLKSSAIVSVNGNDTILSDLYSGHTFKINDISFMIKLNAGYNLIRIYNPKEPLPDIDRIHIDFNGDGKPSSYTKTGKGADNHPTPLHYFFVFLIIGLLLYGSYMFANAPKHNER